MMQIKKVTNANNANNANNASNNTDKIFDDILLDIENTIKST